MLKNIEEIETWGGRWLTWRHPGVPIVLNTSYAVFSDAFCRAAPSVLPHTITSAKPCSGCRLVREKGWLTFWALMSPVTFFPGVLNVKVNHSKSFTPEVCFHKFVIFSFSFFPSFCFSFLFFLKRKTSF